LGTWDKDYCYQKGAHRTISRENEAGTGLQQLGTPFTFVAALVVMYKNDLSFMFFLKLMYSKLSYPIKKEKFYEIG
jgi:hypothetical protein